MGRRRQEDKAFDGFRMIDCKRCANRAAKGMRNDNRRGNAELLHQRRNGLSLCRDGIILVLADG